MEEPRPERAARPKTQLTKMLPIIYQQMKVMVRQLRVEDEECWEEETHLMAVLRKVRRGRLNDAVVAMRGAIENQKEIDNVHEDVRKKKQEKDENSRPAQRPKRDTNAKPGPAGTVLTGTDQ